MWREYSCLFNKLSFSLFSVSIGSFIFWLGRITDCHNGSGTRYSWSWNSSNFYHEDTMDLSYTDPSFRPIYSLQGISQSVLEVTIEMKQKTLFNYYYLFQELWKATFFNLCKRDDVFEPPFPYFLLFFPHSAYFYLIICYFNICLLSFVYTYPFSPRLSRPTSTSNMAREILDVLFWCCRCCCCIYFFFLWLSFCFVLFVCLFVLA